MSLIVAISTSLTAHSQRTSIDWTYRAIFLFLTALTTAGLVSVPEVVGAQSTSRECIEKRNCPDRVPDNGELVVSYGPGGNQQHVRFSGLPKKHTVPFGGSFWFYYGINRHYARQPGALVVRVVKVRKPQQQYDNPWLKRTLLYRNKFNNPPHPTQKDKFEDDIGRDRYNEWHRGTSGWRSSRLKNDFHVEFQENKKTSNSRNSFVFEPNNNAIQRVYILGYKGVRRDGTWVDFTINFDKSFNEVHITIIDLGIDTRGDPQQWNWSFMNSAK